jgi:hypothetical protein
LKQGAEFSGGVLLATAGFVTAFLCLVAVPSQVQATEPDYITTAHDQIPNFCKTTTIVSVADGNWTASGSWNLGRVPTSSDVVQVATGTTITFNSSAATVDCVGIHGKLTFKTNSSTQLKVGNLLIYHDGELDVGTVSAPIDASVTATIIIANKALDTSADPSQYGTAFLAWGKVRMHGAAKNTTFMQLATEPHASDTTLTLSGAVTGWNVGDRVVLPDTRQLFPIAPSQVESFTISAISMDHKTLTLNSALQYDHLGARDENSSPVPHLFPHVINLSSNVVVRSESAIGTRGQVLFTDRADIDIRYVAWQDLGRTTSAVIDSTTFTSTGAVAHIGTNQIGRYPPHFHHLMGPTTPQSSGYQYTFIGNAVDGGNTVRDFKWGITIHDSHYGLLQDNVVFNVAGAGIVYGEDGSETANHIVHNAVIAVKGAPNRRGDDQSVPGNDLLGDGSEGAGIWGRNFQNVITDNVTYDTADYGYVMFAFLLGNRHVPRFQGADTSIASQTVTVNENSTNIDGTRYKFSNNTAVSTWGCMTYWWLGSDADPQRLGPSYIDGFHCWNFRGIGLYEYDTTNLTIRHAELRGDPTNRTAIAVGPADYIQIRNGIEDSIFTGVSIGWQASTNGAAGDATTFLIQESGGVQWFKRNKVRADTCVSVPYLWTSRADASYITPVYLQIEDMDCQHAPGGHDIQYASDASTVNWIVLQRVFLKTSDGNRYQVFSPIQAPDEIVPQSNSAAGSIGAPVAGLTNTQAMATYGIANGGEIASCLSTMTGVDGYVCPISPTPPVISNVHMLNIGTASAVAAWTTDVPSSSVVDYGETTAYGSRVQFGSGAGLINHEMFLSGLQPNTAYHFLVTSELENGVAGSGSDFTFTTTPSVANLLAHWTFDEGQGVTAIDSGVGAYDATLFNGDTWTTSGASSGAIVLNGTTQYAKASVVTTDFPFSFYAWFKTSDQSAANRTIIAESNILVDGNYYHALRLTPAGKAEYRLGTSGPSVLSSSTYNDGQWHQIVGVSASSSNHKLYIDGALVGQSLTPMPGLFVTPTVMTVGAMPSPIEFFPGTIDDARVYTKALTASEVLGLYQNTPVPNTAPTVSAGSGHTITLPNTASLSGSASDDGLPNPPGALTYTWSKVSGPGTVAFSATGSLSTTASFSATGSYLLRLVASDSELTGTGTVTITVNPFGTNTGPTVSAGSNQTITLPSGATLTGSGSDDGLPDPPGALTYTWSKVSGPGTVAFSATGSVTTTASFSQSGSYVLRLSATDTDLTGSGTVTVTVNPEGSLVGYWKFDETLGGTAIDSSGRNNDGTYIDGPALSTDVPPVNFPDSYSRSFGGTGAYVDIPSSSSLNLGAVGQNQTITFWVKSTDHFKRQGFIDKPGSTWPYFMEYDAGIIRYDIYDGTHIPILSTSPNLADGQWHHIASVRDTAAGKLYLYHNGSLVDTEDDTTTMSANNNVHVELGFGRAPDRFLQGNLDEVCIFNNALSAGEIASVMTDGCQPNAAPTVSAGSGQTITLPNTASLTGSASDDGLPNPPAALTYTWSKLSGPGTVTFSATGSLSTIASFSQSGSYILQLAASDSDRTGTGAVTITVNAAGLTDTTTSVASSLNPSVFGSNVRFTGTVSPSSATGTLTFKDGSTTIGTATLGHGSGSIVVSTLRAGSHSLTAVYAGNATYATSTSPALTQTVSRTSSVTTISSSLNPSTFGSGILLTTTVTPSSATGTLTFSEVNGAIISTIGTATLGHGSGSFVIASLSVGDHVLKTFYSGNSNYLPSTSGPLTQTVESTGPTSTTTILASSLNPSTYGSGVTLTATVTSSSATGSITFKDGATTIGTATLGHGSGSYTTSSLVAGSHSLTAVYAGNSTYAGSTSNTVTQTVNTAATTTTLVSVANPSTYGNSVTLTATLTPSTATGTLTFKDGLTTIGTATLGHGSGSISLSSIRAGSHSLTVVYAGNSNYSGSTSNTVTQAVTQATSTTTLVSGANPSIVGNSVTLTATISPSTGTGTLTFKDGSTTLGTATIGHGSGSFATSALSVGSHPLTAVYAGNSNFSGSTSNTVTQVVSAVSSSTVLASSLNPSTYGSGVTLTATVTPSTATGTFTFMDDLTTLGTATIGHGSGHLVISSLTAGAHTIVAVYGGDTTRAGSTSNSLVQTVQKKTTSLVLTSSKNPGFYASGVTLRATVTPGTAAGTVTFKDGSVTIGTGSLAQGSGSYTTLLLSIGSHSLTAVYAGAANFSGSTTSTLTQVVNTGSLTTTALVSSLNPSVDGESVTFTATVTPHTATGTLTFKDGSTTIGTTTLANGSGSFVTASLSAGSHSITAVYDGTSAHEGSTSAALVQVVSAAPSANDNSGGGSGGTGGGGRGGGGGGGRAPAAQTTPASTGTQTDANPGGSLPAVNGNLQVTIGGRPVVLRDVPVHSWFASFIRDIVANGLASGYADAQGHPIGLFGPGDPVTYAQLAKMALATGHHDVSSAGGLPQNRSARGQWSQPYIRLAETLRLSAYSPSLDVNAPASRGAVVQTILESLGIPLQADAPNPFHDLSVRDPYRKALTTAAALGLISGDTGADGKPTGYVRSAALINRAETAKILAKALTLGKK